jgi:hypothetical protein
MNSPVDALGHAEGVALLTRPTVGCQWPIDI